MIADVMAAIKYVNGYNGTGHKDKGIERKLALIDSEISSQVGELTVLLGAGRPVAHVPGILEAEKTFLQNLKDPSKFEETLTDDLFRSWNAYFDDKFLSVNPSVRSYYESLKEMPSGMFQSLTEGVEHSPNFNAFRSRVYTSATSREYKISDAQRKSLGWKLVKLGRYLNYMADAPPADFTED